jgi:recombinational DNA repair ATPase RecF
MSPIDKIILRNFKAFPNEENGVSINFKNNNVLLYGENGSGKSSIYWSLYTLFQSSSKSESQIQKYFDPTSDEHLINLHYLQSRPDFETKPNGSTRFPESVSLNAYVEVLLENKQKLRIDSRGFTSSIIETDGTETPNTDTGKIIISNLNRVSDFIAHRLLINFYNFRNSKEINLWEVFVRDLFPFLKSDKGHADFTLWDRLKNIENNFPFNYNANGTFNKSRSKIKKDWIRNEINLLNEDIEYWLVQINGIVQPFYEEHFEELYKDNLKINLEYKTLLKYSHYQEQYHIKDDRKYHRTSTFAGLNLPLIKLNLEIEKSGMQNPLISRPQSYLNEARLTCIALAIRFSLLDDSIKPDTDGQFLALDDLLVSLDMNNRDKVMDILLGVFAKKFKIYLFTHDKLFFDFVQLKIEEWDDKNNWEIKEMYSGENYKPIIIEENLSFISKAKVYFKSFDYYSAGNNIRKAIEKKLEYLLPETIRVSTRDLDHELRQLFTFYDDNSFGDLIDATLRSHLLNYKDIVFNPSSHFDLRSPLYKIEIEKAFEVYNILKTLPKITRHLLVGMRGSLFYRHNEKDYSATFILKENLYASYVVGASARLSNPKHKLISYTQNKVLFYDPATGVSKDEAGQEASKTEIKLSERPRRINHFINPTDDVILEDFTLVDGTTLQALIDQIPV